VRVAYALCNQTPGAELDEFKQFTTFLPMHFGDDMLRFNGIGERVTTAMYNNPHPADIDLLRHEKFESDYMASTGDPSYGRAHDATNDAGYTWDPEAAARDGV